MKIEWLDAAKAVQFGDSLADYFMRRVPLPSEKKKSKGLEKQFEAVDRMFVQVEQFKVGNKLNVYKKARLTGAFKSKLIDAGYDPKLVDEVALGIMKIL